MKKKKICFILPSLGGGGAEKVAYNLLNNMSLKNYELYLILTKEDGEYLKNLKKEINIKVLNYKRSRYSILELYKEIKKLKPEIVIIFSFEISMLVGVLIRPLFKNIKFINRQLNLISKIRFNFLRKLFLRIAYGNFDKIITQSKDMTKDLLENISTDKKKIIEINNPVNINEIIELSNKNNQIEFKPDNKNLLCVGRLSKQKGFDKTIKIMRFFKETNVKLYILGEGTERKNLEKLIENYSLKNTVFLLGRKENPYIYMKNADLFILSSRYEGFPNVLLEAGACGLYSICDDSPGGINEIIEENTNGNIVDFNNEKLVEKFIIEKLDKIKDKKLTEKSILDRYSMNIIIKKYEKLLEGI